MAAAAPPPPPERPDAPPVGDPGLVEVWQRVQEALIALPNYFRSETNIEGVGATDLFTLSSTLGASIEVQVVRTLNLIREVWETDEVKLYGFRRYEQVFPDVRFELGLPNGNREVKFGIELKGWYLLSKEAEPSFRYKVDPDACSQWDLLVVVPWYLTNVLSGRPVVLQPFIERARWAAEKRNHWWEHEKQWQRAEDDRSIVRPSGVGDLPPYPMKKEKISDRAITDSGGNFGRIARVGVMDEYVERMLDQPLAGVPARSWITFLKRHAEVSSDV